MAVTFLVAFLVSQSCDKQNAISPTPSGIGGSMARFTIVGNYMYVIDERNLKVFDITAPESPIYVKDIEIGFGIETIFPYNQKLFIGSEDGMHIYDITNPLTPVYISIYTHILSCDPVVVSDTVAYVTLRNGSSCRVNTGVNLLEIVNIKDLENPRQMTTYDMNEPYGLGVDDSLLFVCDGSHGLVIFNVKNPDHPFILRKIEGIDTYDVIPYQKRLLITGSTGLYQYDYSNPDSVYFLSGISINNK